MRVFVALCTLLCTALSFAQNVTQPDSLGDAAGFLPVIVSAFKNGQFLVAGALISLVLTFLVGKYALPKLNLGAGVLPIVSALIGCIAGVSLAVANGAPLVAATLAVFSGPLAGTLWDSIVKYFFKKP